MEMRVYDMVINEHDETGVDINSFVQSPAHIRSFEMYGKEGKILFKIDEEKRIVTGVFIQANFLIYRNDKQLGEHFVKFSADTIWSIRNKFFKKGFQGNTNVEHGPMIKGATLVESYIVHNSDPRFPRVPGILSGQKVNDGSWIGSYHIENSALWQDCKNGTFTGFSVEGYFDKVITQVKKVNMKDKKKNSFFKNIFGTEEQMGEAKTVDGVVLFYGGDLKEGTAVQIEVDGEKIAAGAGDHQLEIDGKTFAITLDEEGKVSTMEEVEAMSDEAEALSEAIRKVVKDANGKFAAMETKYEKRIKELEDGLEAVSKGGKFSAEAKKSGEGKKNWKELS